MPTIIDQLEAEVKKLQHSNEKLQELLGQARSYVCAESNAGDEAACELLERIDQAL